MKTPALFLLWLLVCIALTDAAYKKWIPNTNFENASNWNERRVPCSQDKVIFPSGQRVSIYVQSAHSLAEMNLPWDGEFILATGAGFSASSKEDPECDPGSEIHFRDPDQYQWFDPTLWYSSLSDNDKSLFSVDSERVPCQYDDVIFSPETSFKVNAMATEATINLKSISVLGKTFTTDEEFSYHLQSNTGKLQFPGSPRMHITNTPCGDQTGCECGNTAVLREICSALQRTEGICPNLPCPLPLLPAGRCCQICGAIINLEHMSTFNFEDYRTHLVQTYLNLEKYSRVKLAISKVQNQRTRLKKNDLTAEIQIMITDNLEESATGSDAIGLANDIINEINNNGISFGISKATVITSTSSQSAPNTAGIITGIVIGVLAIFLSILGGLYYLHRVGTLRLPSQIVLFRRNNFEVQTDTQPIGFTNPIFEGIAEDVPDVSGLYSGEEVLKEITPDKSSFQYSNPLYEASQCDD
ncbi:Hypothetical predicted protein [Pelobates cultripes]|uniref:Protein amnionless n=1 Tax=Pelobates cultripes TaxID=61616 RepID=A0AAD1TJR8_PELCU|nr:Hypothetical predicted protein [Pelobates cultripes]